MESCRRFDVGVGVFGVGEEHFFGNLMVVVRVLQHLLGGAEAHPCVGGGGVGVGIFEINVEDTDVGIDERSDAAAVFYVETWADVVAERVGILVEFRMFVVVLQDVCAVVSADVHGNGAVIAAFQTGGRDGKVAVDDGIGQRLPHFRCGIDVFRGVDVGIIHLVLLHDVVKVKICHGKFHGCE